MVLLPDGFGLPPLAHTLVLVVSVGVLAAVFYDRHPRATGRHVLGLTPWIVLGSCLHVLYVVGLLPRLVRPFAGTPAVYFTVAVLAGTTWVVSDAVVGDDQTPRVLAGLGLISVVPALVLAVWDSLQAGTLTPFWPTVTIAVSVPLAIGVWVVLVRLRPRVAVTGGVGVFVVFAHALDAVSTAVGVDVLGFGERTPLSRWIVEFAAMLPTADPFGVGWLFVLVKLVVAAIVVALLADYVAEEPVEGYLLLGLVGAVGLGPGFHNVLLFAIAG